jgi:acyl carrier protein
MLFSRKGEGSFFAVNGPGANMADSGSASVEPVNDPSVEAFDDASMKRTLDAMRDVLTRRFGLPDADLSMDRDLASLGMDSLAFFEYAFELEEELGITLPDLPRDMVTIGDFARFINGEVLRKAAESSST